MVQGSRKRWSDLSREQRAAVVAAGTVQIGLQVAALVDLRRRSARELNGSKPLWVGPSFENYAGPQPYFADARRR
jgi:hypothetical protein